MQEKVSFDAQSLVGLSVIFSLTDFFSYFSHRNSNVLIDRSMSTCPELSGSRKYKFLLVSIKFRSELDHYVSCFPERTHISLPRFVANKKLKSFIKGDGFFTFKKSISRIKFPKQNCNAITS